MKLPRFAGLLSLALALLMTNLAHGLPTAASSNLTITPALERRECSLRPTTATTGSAGSTSSGSPATTIPSRYDCDLTPPTLNQIISHMRDPAYDGLATAQSQVFFYTGLGAAEGTTAPWMIGWLRSQGITNYYWVKNAIVPWFNAQLNHINANKDIFQNLSPTKQDPITTLILCSYEALSLAVLNPTVYLFTPEGHQARQNSVWNALEFPALTRNPNVKEIWRVDPRPPQVRGVDPEKCEPPRPQLLWSHTRGDARPKQLLKCDWR